MNCNRYLTYDHKSQCNILLGLTWRRQKRILYRVNSSRSRHITGVLESGGKVHRVYNFVLSGRVISRLWTVAGLKSSYIAGSWVKVSSSTLFIFVNGISAGDIRET